MRFCEWLKSSELFDIEKYEIMFTTKDRECDLSRECL